MGVLTRTRTANLRSSSFFAAGHLDSADHARWLGEEAATPEELQTLIRPSRSSVARLPHRPRIGNVK
jgi:hypothetical protein